MKIIIIIVAIIVLVLAFKFKISLTKSNESEEEFNEAVLENIKDSQIATEENIKLNREKLGSFLANVSGMVRFTHHIGSDLGEDMFWLEEYALAI